MLGGLTGTVKYVGLNIGIHILLYNDKQGLGD